MKQMIKQVAIAYFCSRAIVFLIILACSGLVNHDTMLGNEGSADAISVSQAGFEASLVRLATMNDAGWYYGIAKSGYERREFDRSDYANWAFFPLHPLTWRAVIETFGDHPIAEIAFVNILFLIALFVLYRVVIGSGRGEGVAARAVFVVCLFPTSYFFSFPWTESLFLLLSASCFLCAQRGHWKSVLLFGALASGTRFAGVFLVPAVALFYCHEQIKLGAVIAWTRLVLIGSICSGLFAFMFLLWYYTGNPLAFSDIQTVWGRSLEVPVRAIGIIFLKPHELAVAWNVRYLNLAVVVLALLAIRHFIYRKEWGFACFLVLGVLAPLMTGAITSMPRYAMALFPFSIAAADWMENQSVDRVWFVVSSALLALMCVAFASVMNFAGT